MKKTLFITLNVLFFMMISCTKKSETYFESMNTFMKVQAYGKKAEEANAAAQKYIGEMTRDDAPF